MHPNVVSRIKPIIVLAVLSLLVAAGTAAMADTPEDTAKPQSEIALYGWLTGINADLAVSGIETSVDASFSDIFESLNMAGMVYYETWGKQNTGFYLNYIGARIGEEEQRPLVNVDWQVFQTIVEAGVLMRKGNPETPVDVTLGMRYVNMDTDLTLTPGGSGSVGDSWIDPTVGVRYSKPLSDKWNFAARGDIGGIVFGSDFSWSLSGMFNYRMNPDWELGVGYRHLDLDRDNDDFDFDGSISGPIVGFAYTY